MEDQNYHRSNAAYRKNTDKKIKLGIIIINFSFNSLRIVPLNLNTQYIETNIINLDTKNLES